MTSRVVGGELVDAHGKYFTSISEASSLWSVVSKGVASFLVRPQCWKRTRNRSSSSFFEHAVASSRLIIDDRANSALVAVHMNVNRVSSCTQYTLGDFECLLSE